MVSVGTPNVEGGGVRHSCRVCGPLPYCPVGFGVKVISHRTPVLLKQALE